MNVPLYESTNVWPFDTTNVSEYVAKTMGLHILKITYHHKYDVGTCTWFSFDYENIIEPYWCETSMVLYDIYIFQDVDTASDQDKATTTAATSPLKTGENKYFCML